MKILIVDDRVRTGMFLTHCTNWLVSNFQIKSENITSACLVVSKGLVVAKAAPTYYFLDSDDYYFPWD